MVSRTRFSTSRPTLRGMASSRLHNQRVPLLQPSSAPNCLPSQLLATWGTVDFRRVDSDGLDGFDSGRSEQVPVRRCTQLRMPAVARVLPRRWCVSGLQLNEFGVADNSAVEPVAHQQLRRSRARLGQPSPNRIAPQSCPSWSYIAPPIPTPPARTVVAVIVVVNDVDVVERLNHALKEREATGRLLMRSSMRELRSPQSMTVVSSAPPGSTRRSGIARGSMPSCVSGPIRTAHPPPMRAVLALLSTALLASPGMAEDPGIRASISQSGIDYVKVRSVRLSVW